MASLLQSLTINLPFPLMINKLKLQIRSFLTNNTNILVTHKCSTHTQRDTHKNTKFNDVLNEKVILRRAQYVLTHLKAYLRN